MNTIKKALGAIALASVMTTLFAIAPASAANPEERLRFVEEISGEDPFIAEVCGLERIDASGSVKVRVDFFEDGSIRAHENLKLTLTNPDTGDQVIVTQARTVRDRFEMIEGDGVIIERGELSFVGSTEKWRAVGGGGVIIADAGRLDLSFEAVLDAETFELISFKENVVINGPHPLFEEPPFEAVCPVLGGSFVGFPDEF
jgi:hypothetical protein